MWRGGNPLSSRFDVAAALIVAVDLADSDCRDFLVFQLRSMEVTCSRGLSGTGETGWWAPSAASLSGEWWCQPDMSR
jgi:hypothetical protein